VEGSRVSVETYRLEEGNDGQLRQVVEQLQDPDGTEEREARLADGLVNRCWSWRRVY
jgi:hypothetical protein